MELEHDNASGLNPDCDFNSKQRNKILIAMGITACISLIACILTVCRVFCLRLQVHFSYRLALYQVVASMFFSVSLIIQLSMTNLWEKAAWVCEIFGFLLEYFMWVKLLFTIILIFHFFVLAVCLKNLHKYELVYVLLPILLPALYVWIPFIRKVYGNAGAWCWIKDWIENCAYQNSIAGVVEQFVLWYVPLFISLTISIGAAIIVVVILTRRAYYSKIGNNSEAGPLLYTTIQAETRHNQAALKQLIPLLAYPVIFYVLSIMPLINRIYDAAQTRVSYSLALTHAVSIGSWGFFSSLALLIHIAVKRKLKSRTIEKPHHFEYSNPSTFQTGGFEQLESSVKSD